MLNQSFSVENFRIILDLENRKGVFLEGEFFPSLKPITEDIKECNKNIENKKKVKNTSENELKELYDKRKNLKEKKEVHLNAELQKISEKVVATNFKIELTKRTSRMRSRFI